MSSVEATVCPVSGTSGPRVGLITLKALLKGNALRRLEGEAYRFCPEGTCDVVYFDSGTGSVFRKRDKAFRVGQKETEDPIPVCYCFEFTVADLRREIEIEGETRIPAAIAAEIEAGRCACEVKNPRGSCCLGDVSNAIRSIRLGAVEGAKASSRAAAR